MSIEFQELLKQWNCEAEATLALLQALPPNQYDFRPDPPGRSIGELAWHLAENDGRQWTIGNLLWRIVSCMRPIIAGS